METDAPVETLITRIESALDQVANHCNQLVERLALRRHFWIMARGKKHIPVLLDLEE